MNTLSYLSVHFLAVSKFHLHIALITSNIIKFTYTKCALFIGKIILDQI